MNSQKNIFLLSIIFSLFVSGFMSFFVYETRIKDELNNKTIILNNSKTDNSYKNKITNEEVQQYEKNKQNIVSLEQSVKYLAKKMSQSVVSIVISKDIQLYRTDPFWFFQEPSWVVKRKVGWWTGFFVNKDGLILTNKHVVSDPNAQYSIILNNWDEYVGKVIAVDPTTDLAIVQALTSDGKKLSNTQQVSFIKNSNNTEVWSFVIAIWNALAEFQNTVTFGVISWLGRSIEAWDQNWISSEQLTWLIQTDTAINPGNSWWPLVNLSGEVVWINTAIAQWANGLGFAIPLSENEVKHLITSVSKYGKITRPFIWIRYFSLNSSIAKQLKININYWDYIGSIDWQNGVISWSPADKAWIMNEDVIIEVDGTKLTDWLSTKDIIKNKFPKDKVIIKVFRKWEIKIIELVLWEYGS